MIYVLTPEQMRAADQAAIARMGEDALMRNAGLRIAERVRAMAERGSRIVAFAGPGNNGGDAFSALAELTYDHDCRRGRGSVRAAVVRARCGRDARETSQST